MVEGSGERGRTLAESYSQHHARTSYEYLRCRKIFHLISAAFPSSISKGWKDLFLHIMMTFYKIRRKDANNDHLTPEIIQNLLDTFPNTFYKGFFNVKIYRKCCVYRCIKLLKNNEAFKKIVKLYIFVENDIFPIMSHNP